MNGKDFVDKLLWHIGSTINALGPIGVIFIFLLVVFLSAALA